MLAQFQATNYQKKKLIKQLDPIVKDIISQRKNDMMEKKIKNKFEQCTMCTTL